MKKLYILLLLTICSVSFTIAQNKNTKKADDLYDSYAFTEAIKAYKSLIKKGEGDTYIYTRLANSYYELGDYKNAESLYKQAVKSENPKPELLYAYAQTLKANGKAKEYESWMNKFAEARPNDSRAKKYKMNPTFLSTLTEREPLFTIKNAESLNSTYSDYGSHIQGNTLYFASSRNTSRKIHALNDQPFLDIYTATVDGSKMGPSTLLSGDVNTKYHEGKVAISPDGKRMYFDRNDFIDKKLKKDENGLSQINLYTAEKVGGAWINIKSVAFNSDEFSTGHPALSPDGNTLYFSSDRPGGKGGADLYKVSVKKDGTFGAVTSLGEPINTEGTEVFPFVSQDGTLYFSSTGHLGLGGLDVFSTSLNTASQNIKNLGLGVNSASDDFAIYLNNDGLTGYVSSNRPGGAGSDDIYILGQVPPCDVEVALTVEDPNGNAIPKAMITLENTYENTLDSDTATTTGKYLFLSKCNRTYDIRVAADGFQTKEGSLTVEKGDLNRVITLEPIQEPVITETEVILNPIYFDFDKSNIRPSAAAELDRLVGVMTKYPTMIISAESHTDKRGPDSYNQQLSERRARSMMNYVIDKGISASRISSVGKGESEPAVACGSTCTEEEHQQNRRSVFRIVQR